MTIGIAAFGPRSGAGVLSALRAVEGAGRGAIGGFVSFAALTEDGTLVRACTQVGGVEQLFPDTQTNEITSAPLAGLISSGPNRPEPLSDFVAAEPGVGIVTGHRMPNTRTADGVALNAHVIAKMKAGADPQSAIDYVIARYPEMDAGFLALSIDGRIGLGNMPSVMLRGDEGSGILKSDGQTECVATIHNAIHPHHIISQLANEIALDTMLRPQAPTAWFTISSGVQMSYAATAQIWLSSSNTVERIFHPQRIYLTGEWSVGMGDKVAIVKAGRHHGWLGYEPFMTLKDGIVQNIDGQTKLELPIMDRLSYTTLNSDIKPC